jgi:hypothetical protein
VQDLSDYLAYLIPEVIQGDSRGCSRRIISTVSEDDGSGFRCITTEAAEQLSNRHLCELRSARSVSSNRRANSAAEEDFRFAVGLSAKASGAHLRQGWNLDRRITWIAVSKHDCVRTPACRLDSPHERIEIRSNEVDLDPAAPRFITIMGRQ